MKRWLLAALVVTVFVSVAVLAQVQGEAARNPLAQFYHDGKLTIPGGAFTKELQQLLFPPPAPTTYTTYAEARSAYPTMSVVGTVRPVEKSEWKAPDPVEGVHAFGDAFAAWLGPMPDWGGLARGAADWFFGLFTFNAAAACGSGGGSCFWIGGTGSFSQTAHWSASTGGATCSCTPAATDSVTFDASSGAGTATQDNATFTSGAVTMTNSSVTVAGSSNTWNVGGNWADANGKFSRGTSTLDFTASVSITAAGGGSCGPYNLTIDASTTLTLGSRVSVCNVVTINGTLALGANNFDIRGGAASPVVFGASGAITNSGSIWSWLEDGTATTVTIPARTDWPGWRFEPVTNNMLFQLGGDVTLSGGVDFLIINTGSTLSTQNHAVTLGGGFTTTTNGAFGILFGSSTVSVAGTSSLGSSIYFDLGSSAWTISAGGATWTNASTSASWSAGSSSVTFTSNTGGTLVFAGANLSGAEWGSVTLTSGAATAQSFTMSTRALNISGTLAISDGSSTTNLDTSASNLAITAGAVTVAAGGILTGEASTITIGGAWDSSGGTFTYGTSTLVVNASTTVKTPSVADTDRFYNLTVNGTFTATMQSHFRVTHVVTLGASSTVATGGFQMTIGPGVANMIVCGASAAFTGTGTIKMGYTSGAYNVPACTYPNLITGGGTTVTVTGTLTIGASLTVAGAGSTATTLVASTNTITVGASLTLNAAANTGILTFTTGSISVVANTTIGSGGYIVLGSGSHSFGGTWTDSSTSASWSAGTGTVTFSGSSGSAAYTMTFGNHGVAIFNNVTFLSTSSTYVAFTQSGPMWTTGALTVEDNGGVTCTQPTPPAGQNCTSLVTDTSSDTIGSYLVDTGGLVYWNFNAAVTANGNWVIQNGGRQQSVFNTVTFAANANIGDSDPNQNFVYGIVINLGITVTNTTNVFITNTATINGTLLGGAVNNPQLQFVVLGIFTNSGPIVTLGGAADVSQSGYFIYAFSGPGSGAYTVAGGHYQHLAIESANGLTVNLGGNIDTTDGGACAASADGSRCAVLVAGYSVGTTINFNTANFSMSVGGVLWFGDLGSQHANANLGSSTITVGDCLDVLANSTVNFSTASITTNRFAGETNGSLQAISTEYQGQIDMGSATVIVNGDIKMNAYGILPAQIINFHGATVTVSGGVTIVDPIDYMLLGTASVSVAGTWSNSSTSSSWSMGTSSTVTFTWPTSRTYTPTTSLPVTEFFNLRFSTSAVTQQTFTLGGNLTIGGTFTINGSNTLFDLGSPTAFNLSEHGLSLTSGGVLQLRTSTVTTFGNWDDTGGTLQRFQTDTEVFAASGTINAGAAPTSHFYNMTVNLGVTTTLLTGFMVANILTVNGTVIAGSPNDPQMQFGTFCTSSSNPCVVLGASGDLSQSGYFTYLFLNSGDQYVTATVYQHLAIEGQATTVAHLRGNISTVSCGVYNACAIILLQQTAGSAFTVRSENFSITAGGSFWIGDGGSVGVTFYAGSSTITAFGISPNGAGIAHWQTATIIAHPSSIYDPIAYYQVDTAIGYGENSTWTVHGSWKLWESAPTYFVAGSAVITILNDEGSNTALGHPGNVYLKGTGYIEFDTSTWSLNGDTWQTTQGPNNLCGSGSSVTFTGTVAAVMSLNGNCLPKLTVASGKSLGFVDNAAIVVYGLTVMGTFTFTVSGASFGSATFGIALIPTSGVSLSLSTWNVWAPSGPNIDFPIALSQAGASLTITVFGMDSFALGAFKDGTLAATFSPGNGGQTATVDGPWSTHDITISQSANCPTGQSCGGGGGAGGNPPQPSMTAAPSSDGYTFVFTMTAPTGYVLSSVTWSFGDGATATGTTATHTYSLLGVYVVTATVKFTTGYGVTVTKTVSPLGPANQIPGYVPLMIVLGAVVALLLVFLSESENRRIWLALVALAIFWAAWVYVAATDFPSAIPRDLFAYFPLAVGAVGGLMAMEKANRKKLVWVVIAVAAVLVWAFVVVAVG